jgi:non-canonical purine NTP pyrophosphatase (RdgB/HAM1 family)
MQKLVFVTGNDNKAREASAVLGVELERIKIDLDEIQSMDLRVIVEHKAREAYKKILRPIIVEDVSFEIDQWRGFPGPFTKWLAVTIGYAGLPGALRPKNRSARWRAMYGYFDGTLLKTFEGVEEGSVAHKARGTAWGFDVVFIPKGQKKTVAELGEAAKAKTSARALALRKMRRFLSTLR